MKPHQKDINALVDARLGVLQGFRLTTLLTGKQIHRLWTLGWIGPATPLAWDTEMQVTTDGIVASHDTMVASQWKNVLHTISYLEQEV